MTPPPYLREFPLFLSHGRTAFRASLTFHAGCGDELVRTRQILLGVPCQPTDDGPDEVAAVIFTKAVAAADAGEESDPQALEERRRTG